MVREATNWVIEQIEAGALDAETVARACLCYMSEDEVADMCHANELGWSGNDNYSDDDDDDDDDSEDD